MHLDANNLYGCPMNEKLPVGKFKWIKNVAKIDKEFIKNHDENGDIVDKVDIEYHKELNDLHIGFPFLPEKIDVKGHNKLLCRYNDKLCCPHKEHKTSNKTWCKTETIL